MCSTPTPCPPPPPSREDLSHSKWKQLKNHVCIQIPCCASNHVSRSLRNLSIISTGNVSCNLYAGTPYTHLPFDNTLIFLHISVPNAEIVCVAFLSVLVDAPVLDMDQLEPPAAADSDSDSLLRQAFPMAERGTKCLLRSACTNR